MERGMIVGIAGPSGSGKTFVADGIMGHLGAGEAVIIPEDSYYRDLSELPYEERAVTNFDHPDAFDHDLLADHLLRLLRGQAIARPVYEYTRHCRSKETRTVGPCALLIVEGILILNHARLRELMDLRVFIDTALDICLMRRLERDIAERGRTVDSVIQQYRETVRPMYLRFVEPSRRYADLVLSGGAEDASAVDALAAKIGAMLHKDCR
jgi:uridine kinase